MELGRAAGLSALRFHSSTGSDDAQISMGNRGKCDRRRGFHLIGRDGRRSVPEHLVAEQTAEHVVSERDAREYIAANPIIPEHLVSEYVASEHVAPKPTAAKRFAAECVAGE